MTVVHLTLILANALTASFAVIAFACVLSGRKSIRALSDRVQNRQNRVEHLENDLADVERKHKKIKDDFKEATAFNTSIVRDLNRMNRQYDKLSAEYKKVKEDCNLLEAEKIERITSNARPIAPKTRTVGVPKSIPKTNSVDVW